MQTGDIIICQTKVRETSMEVKLKGVSVWRHQYQLAELFQSDKFARVKLTRNTYNLGELSKEATCVKQGKHSKGKQTYP